MLRNIGASPMGFTIGNNVMKVTTRFLMKSTKYVTVQSNPRSVLRAAPHSGKKRPPTNCTPMTLTPEPFFCHLCCESCRHNNRSPHGSIPNVPDWTGQGYTVRIGCLAHAGRSGSERRDLHITEPSHTNHHSGVPTMNSPTRVRAHRFASIFTILLLTLF